MNLLNLKLLILSIFFLCTNFSWAQIETLKYAHSADTCVPANTSDYNRLIKYFLEDHKEVKQLFKLNMMQAAYGRLNLSYERKIGEKFSIEPELTIGLPFSFHSTHGILYLLPEVNLKYYHNFNKRAFNGYNTNGFSGNYFTFGIAAHINRFGENNFVNHPSYDTNSRYLLRTNKHSANENIISTTLGYGIQRRIGNIGYACIEGKMGFGTNKNFNKLYLTPELNIKAGFAISKLKKN